MSLIDPRRHAPMAFPTVCLELLAETLILAAQSLTLLPRILSSLARVGVGRLFASFAFGGSGTRSYARIHRDVQDGLPSLRSGAE